MHLRSLGPDTVFVNAAGVITMEGTPALDRAVTAIAVREGRIVGFGPDAVIKGMAPDASVVDLGGAFVMPGLIDCHNHFVGTSLGAMQVQLSEARSIEELVEVIGARAATLEPGEWVTCSSRWHETNLAEKRLPLAAELDRLTPQNPVYLPRGGHVVVTNSVGLRLAGIQEESPDPEGGEFVRDAGGHLTGMLLERPAFRLLTRLVPQATDEVRRVAMQTGIETYNRAGITAVREPGITATEMRAYQAVIPTAQSLRASVMWRVDLALSPQHRRSWIEGLAPVSGFGNDWMRVWGLKTTLDGGVEGGYFRHPYANNPDFRGFPLTSPENLSDIISQADGLGWRVGVHVVGDAAMDMVLDAFDGAKMRSAGHMLEHAFSPVPGAIERTRDLGLGVTLQHSLVYALGGNMVTYWGRERAEACTPSRAWLDSGTLVGAGTDSPVTSYDPWLNIYGFATRATQNAGPLGPEHRISIAEALAAYTVGSARVLDMADEIGSIAPGKLADFICLDRDPLSSSAEAVRDMVVRRTVVGGRTVHEAATP